MKKVEAKLTYELMNHEIVGFQTSRNKGFLTAAGGNKIIAVSDTNTDSHKITPNSPYGMVARESSQLALDAVNASSYPLKSVYVFETFKELFTWLAQ